MHRTANRGMADAKQETSGKMGCALFLPLLLALFETVAVFGCASSGYFPPRPPRYLYHEDHIAWTVPGSLLSDSGICREVKAARQNEPLTILLAQNDAISMCSMPDAGIQTMPGMPPAARGFGRLNGARIGSSGMGMPKY